MAFYNNLLDRFGRWMNWVNAGKSIRIDKKRKAKTKAKPCLCYGKILCLVHASGYKDSLRIA